MSLQINKKKTNTNRKTSKEYEQTEKNLNHITTQKEKINIVNQINYSKTEKSTLAYQKWQNSACFPLSFIASILIFRPLIHFEFIFVCEVRDSSNFILYMQLSSFYLEKTIIQKDTGTSCSQQHYLQ